MDSVLNTNEDVQPEIKTEAILSDSDDPACDVNHRNEIMEMSDNPVIGIDLGTTHCCVGYYRRDERRVHIIKNDVGERTTPSYVFFSDNETCIGKFAKEQVHFVKENIVYDSKRLIGQDFDSKQVQKNIKNWPFRVIRGANNKPLVRITTSRGSNDYEAEDISAKLLGYMKHIAEGKLDAKVENVVITVPAYFNYHQRTATQRAGKLAGLNVLRIINEPTAAALAYVHHNQRKGSENLLIFDLGGGTFDVSVVTVTRNKSVIVKATSGNTYLGGRDFDENLSNFIATQLESKFRVSVKNRKHTMRKIRARSEKTKIDLSQTAQVDYDIESLNPWSADLDFVITRTDFERTNSDLFQDCINIVKDCLTDAKTTARDIDKVVLCGGSSRIPKLQQMLINLFGERKLNKSLDPDEAVAYGAALQAATMKEDEEMAIMPKIQDITPLSLGIRTLGGVMRVIVERNSSIPVTKIQTIYTASDKQQNIQFDIYEGERPLVQHNTKIGSCRLSKLPPRPPGYPVYVSLHVNDDGVLEVEAKTDDGIYKRLAIEYEPRNVEEVTDVLREAKLNETKDNATSDVVSKWKALYQYSTRVQTLSTYDNQLAFEETATILNIAKDTLTWLDLNEVKSGNDKEQEDILRKQKQIEAICLPILNTYGYKIQSMSNSEFYEFILNIQRNP